MSRRQRRIRPPLGIESITSTSTASVLSAESELRQLVDEFAGSVPTSLLVHLQPPVNGSGWTAPINNIDDTGFGKYLEVSGVLTAEGTPAQESDAWPYGIKTVYGPMPGANGFGSDVLVDPGLEASFVRHYVPEAAGWRGRCLELVHLVNECRSWLGSDIRIGIPVGVDSVIDTLAYLGLVAASGAVPVVSDAEVAEHPDQVSALACWGMLFEECLCQQRRVQASTLDKYVFFIQVSCQHSASWCIANFRSSGYITRLPALMGSNRYAQYWVPPDDGTRYPQLHGLAAGGDRISIPRHTFRLYRWASDHP